MILVTGANGLVGSHLLYELLSNGESNVIGVYRNETRKSKILQLFKYYSPADGANWFQKIKWVQGDILDVLFLDEIMQGVETVYHCAALVSFQKRDFNRLMLVNRIGTSNVVNASVDNKVKTLVHVSSTAALGAKPGVVVTEETRWKKEEHTSEYSISKYSAEKEAWRGKEEGLNVIVVNPCLIMGAGFWNESSLTIFRAVANGLKFYAPGANAIVDARFVAEAMHQLVKNGHYNQRYLLISENLSIKSLLESIALHLGKKPPHIKVGRLLMNVAWRIASFWAWFRRKPSSITKESARSAFNTTEYDGSKILQRLPDLKIYAKDQMIKNSVAGKLD